MRTIESNEIESRMFYGYLNFLPEFDTLTITRGYRPVAQLSSVVPSTASLNVTTKDFLENFSSALTCLAVSNVTLAVPIRRDGKIETLYFTRHPDYHETIADLTFDMANEQRCNM